MKKYKVIVDIVVSKSQTLYASCKDEAIEKAFEYGPKYFTDTEYDEIIDNIEIIEITGEDNND